MDDVPLVRFALERNTLEVLMMDMTYSVLIYIFHSMPVFAVSRGSIPEASCALFSGAVPRLECVSRCAHSEDPIETINTRRESDLSWRR